MKKLAIVSTHPIQYNAPWFRLLASEKEIEVKVFYTWSQSQDVVKDETFGRDIKWDIPLLDGYKYEFVDNISKKPGSHHFFGMDCPQLIPSIENFNPNVLLIFGWNFKSHLKTIRYFRKKLPIWFRGDSTLLNDKKNVKSFLRFTFLKSVYRYIDKALYVGTANKAYFLKYGLKTTQLIQVPHAIDNERFGDDDKYQNELNLWLRNLGYNDDDIIILFAGKFIEIKRPEFLIKSFIRAKEINSKLKLLMVGNGVLENELKNISKEVDGITFLPFQNQTKMPILYRLGDVFCLPSKSETWGLAINESMASGTPTIVSDKVGCAEDLVKHEKNGFVFNSENDKDLAEILAKLDKEHLKRMGVEAKQYIQFWSFNTIVKSITSNLN